MLWLRDVWARTSAWGPTGVATIPDHGSNPGARLHAADVALYHAKQNGRDRVETATPV